MKVFVVFLLGLLAVSNSMPPQEVAGTAPESRFVGDIIVSIIERLTQQIRDNGYDPWVEKGTHYAVGLPVPVLLDVQAHVEDIEVTGVSNIIINRMDFGLLSNRLNMDISLPRIAISVGDAGLDVTILGSHFDVSANANLVIVEPRVAGMIQFNVGIITGIFVREIDLAFTLGDLQFDGEVKAFGLDFTSTIKELVHELIPQRLRKLEADVNELVNIIALELVNQII